MNNLHDDGYEAALDEVRARNGYEPTDYQKAIYRFIADDEGHAVVNAVAGSGKTATLMDALSFIPSNKRVLMVAFNKHIADELNSRNLPRNVTARTLHSVGNGVIFKNAGPSKLRDDKVLDTYKMLAGYEDMGGDARTDFWLTVPAVTKLVSLYKSFGYGCMAPYPSDSDALWLVNRYDVDLNGDASEIIESSREVLIATLANDRVIDFNDMLAVPVARNWSFRRYDMVFVDEAQDLNPIQVEIVARSLAPDGRAIFVGDRNQAIYGFRGADPDSIDAIISQFNATELPLSICWRCPRSVVDRASQIVPEIEASPSAEEGTVDEIPEEKLVPSAGEGDYVLCRTTAPLVAACLSFIRNERKAVVRGRDIGKSLLALLEKVVKTTPVELPIRERIRLYGQKAVAAMDPDQDAGRILSMTDRCDTLEVLARGIHWGCDPETVDTDEARQKNAIDGITARVKRIFSDSDAGVTLSTIHRAKGLQAGHVFILDPSLLPHPMARQDWQVKQEHNLHYVAITRAQDRLTYVTI